MTKLQQKLRQWNGVTVVLSELRTESGLFLATCSPKHAKLAIAVEQVGGRCDTRLHWQRPGNLPRVGSILHYVPANVPTWCVSKDLRRLRHVALMFEPQFVDGLGLYADRWPDEPRLGLSSPAMLVLARLLADETEAPRDSDSLYGDSLVHAMLALLLRLTKPTSITQNRHTLSAAQLSQIVEYMHANLSMGVDLKTLAGLTGLSQSHFCEAFKRTTGRPPYRYFLALRVERAKAMLLAEPAPSLSALASMLGFSDQSHFTRVFREHVGTIPSKWCAARERTVG